MYGTIARYRTKPGTEQKILQIEADLRAADPPGFLFECILRTDAHPDECFEVVVFDSKEAYFALANTPEQDARYRRLLELLEGEPEWHDGEIIYTNPEPRR